MPSNDKLIVARRFFVRGRVQGVGFRYAAADEARRLGLEGWVRNQPDGSVEVHAQGAESEVTTFETFLRRGPPAARVEEVVVAESELELNASSFDIRR